MSLALTIAPMTVTCELAYDRLNDIGSENAVVGEALLFVLYSTGDTTDAETMAENAEQLVQRMRDQGWQGSQLDYTLASLAAAQGLTEQALSVCPLLPGGPEKSSREAFPTRSCRIWIGRRICSRPPE